MKFYNCNCYFTHNIYVREYNRHFKYFDLTQFNKDYFNVLSDIGCDTESKKNILLQKITNEVNRRRDKEKNDVERRIFLKKFYRPLDQNISTLQEAYLHPSFIQLIAEAKNSNYQKVLELLKIESDEKQIYSFPVFKEGFCHQFLKELDNYNESSMPKERSNTMNKSGILVDDIGYHDNFSLILRNNYLDPLCQVLFPEWRGEGLDSHKVFTVQYKSCEDSQLGYHFDNSEITLNICLGKSFVGGELYFGDTNTTPISESTCILISHKIGYGILHKGRQLHGALDITCGERCNLIMWMRASSVRNKLCPMCNSKPSNLTQASFYGDGFTLEQTDVKNLCDVS